MSDETPEISAALLRKLTARARQRKVDTDDDDIDIDIERDLLRRGRRAMRSQTERTFQSREDIIERLRGMRELLVSHVDYTKGDIVQWKDGLRNRAYPAYGEPVIVISLLESPVFGSDDSGTPQFREPLDAILGWIDDDGDMICFHYDRRRFRKFMGS